MSLTDLTDPVDDDFKALSETEFKKVQSKTSKQGYADGVAAGHEEVFQTAFDKGYAAGLSTGFELEKYKAFYQHLTPKHDEALQQESKAYEGLNIPSTEDTSHFQYEAQKINDIDEASKAQQKHVEQLLTQCAQHLPLATCLLETKQKS